MIEKASFLKGKGYSIGLYTIERPGHERIIEQVGARARAAGLDHRTKEFLGLWRGKVWGTYHYGEALYSPATRDCLCRTSELLIAPEGSVHRCHRDLYLGENPVGRIDSPAFRPQYIFRECSKFGECNPCDVKNKTNRFQVAGHASVEIRFGRRGADA
jgi:hypothetical protein